MLWSRWKLEPFRSNRLAALRQYVGAHYSDDGAQDKVPVNLLELATNIYVRQLAANNPRVNISPDNPDLEAKAIAFGIALNDLFLEIDFEETNQTYVLDALYGMGIVKVGLTMEAEDELHGFFHDGGQAFVDTVDMDDWLHDMSAKRWDQVRYCGNRYSLPYEQVMDLKLFKNRDITPTESQEFNEYGDERSETLSRGIDSKNEGHLEDVIELWDIWIPHVNQVVTLTADGSTNEPLRVIEWDGPEHGPFHLLGYGRVPNQIMPLPPVALWMDLHTLANVLFRKMGRQAERQKENTVFREAEDYRKLKEASDGEGFHSMDPSSLGVIKSGGVDPQNLAFFLQVKDIAFSMGGNLDALGGLSPQSETLGQDQLLHAAAKNRLVDMQDRTTKAIKGIVESLAWYEWTNPVRVRKLKRVVPGTNIEHTITWDRKTREGDFLQYHFEIEPYSMVSSTPGSKLQALANIFDRFVAPHLQAMAAEGKAIDYEELFSVISRWGNLPELTKIMTNSKSLEQEMQGRNGSTQSPVTTRNTIRTNRPGATRKGAEDALTKVLMGANPGAGAAASISRPKGI